MHSASLEKSARLQRVHRVLKDGRSHSTRDISRKAHVCAVSAIVSELRANDVKVDCRRKKNVWSYQLA